MMIPCFSCPSLSFAVDDHVPFLEALELWGIKTTSSLEDAFRRINTFSPPWIKRHEEEFYNQYIIEPMPYKILEESSSPISTLFVDYVMPEMNGLEFLSHIKDKDVFKVLLTGEADEAIAVKAFNQSMIDYYLKKTDLQKELASVLKRGHQTFFWRKTRSFLEILKTISSPTFVFDDPLFIKEFQKFLLNHNIQSYYLIDEYGSFLGRSPDQIFVFASLPKSIYQEFVQDNQVPFTFEERRILLLENSSLSPILNENDHYYFCEKVIFPKSP